MIKAFLDTIAFSEGTWGVGDDGYNVECGGGLFASYDDHPRKAIWLPKLKIFSTAAGRYQILAKNYDAYKKTLNLDNFGPDSQDAIAIKMIKEQHAYPMLQNYDNFEGAVQCCSDIWASLPGAAYGQHTNRMADLRAFYTTRKVALGAAQIAPSNS